MIEKQIALDLASRWVKEPKHVGYKWIVEWLDRTVIRKESCDSWAQGYATYRYKIYELSQKILNHGKKEK